MKKEKQNLMTIGERIRTYFSGPRQARRIILASTTVLVLVLLIVFNRNIQDLFRFLTGRAALTGVPEWIVQGEQVNTARRLAKTIAVTQGGKRYLYLIGGLTADDKLSDSVERLRIDPMTGVPYVDPQGVKAQWETSTGNWGKLYSRHAAMGAVVAKGSDGVDYLYVISGDIHIPYDSNPNPLLFSTIEQLDLNSDTTSWEPVAILAGVNFYPEVAIFNNRLQVVGGVYGYPKEYFIPDFANDQTKWNDEYKSLPIITNGTPISLKDGGLSNDIKIGGTGTSTIGIGGQVISMNEGVQIAALGDTGNPNLAKMLSDALKGEGDGFVTTVSEHYSINLANFSDFQAGELGSKGTTEPGNDYLGTLSDKWELSRVSHLGHLRILVQVAISGYDDPGHGVLPQKDYSVQPAPQGRYGHKLYIANVSGTDRLFVVGGASWSGVINRIYNDLVVGGLNNAYDDPFIVPIHTFWVIEDDYDPVTFSQLFGFLGGIGLGYKGFDYQYIGNVAYRLDSAGTRWAGSNPNTYDWLYWENHLEKHKQVTPNEVGNYRLDSKYAFSVGRAFFGFAQLKPSENVVEYMAVGGLENNPVAWEMGDVGSDMGYNTDYYTSLAYPDTGRIPALRWGHPADKFSFQWCLCGSFGVSINVVDQTDRFTSANGWQEGLVLTDTDGTSYSVYDITAIGLEGQTFAFGGAITFQADNRIPFNNEHVPDSEAGPSAKSFFQKTEQTWITAGPLNAPSLLYAACDVRTPIAIVGGEPKGENVMVYKVSGNNATAVETIGPVAYGGSGVFNPNHTLMEVLPFRDGITGVTPPAWMDWDINGDGTLEPNVPVVKADRYDYATVTITLRDYYDQPVTDASNLRVTLSTSRSPAPAVNKNVWNGSPGNSPGWVPDWIRIAGTVGSDPAGLGAAWHDQFSAVDSNGQAKFRIGSAFNTFVNETTPDPIGLSIRVVDVSGAQLSDGAPGMGMNKLIFTSHGAPSFHSKVVTTSPVKPNGTDASLIIPTLLDIYDDPIPFKRIIIESDRNFDRSVPPNGYDPEDLNDPDDPNDNDQWDIISLLTNGSDITIDTGEAAFTATSTHPFFALMIGYVDNTYDYKNLLPGGHPAHIDDDPAQTLRQQKLGVRTAYIYFSDTGFIESLVPNYGYQGQTISLLTATGNTTQWGSITMADFIRPTMSFFYIDDAGKRQYDLNQVVIFADQFEKKLGVEVAPNEEVHLKIIQGNGEFYPVGTTEIDTTADDKGLANFQYLPDPTEEGLLKIEATAKNSQKVGNLWIPIRQSSSIYEVRMSAEPTDVDEINNQSVITIKAYANGAPLTGNPIKFDYEKNELDIDGTLDKTTDPSITTGIATVVYTRHSLVTGQIRVCAKMTYAGDISVGCITINKTFTTGDPTAKITFDPADLQVATPTLLTINDISIPTLAEIGSWIFQTLTEIYNPISGKNETLTETYPFTVFPAGYQQGPYIVSIDPAPPEGVFIGSEDNLVAIEGANIAFVSQSVITFTRFDWATNQPTNESLTANISEIIDATHMVVSLDVPADTTPGYWDVKVVSGQNTAEKAGHRDFLISTSSGYWIKLRANPTTIDRNGSDTSEINANLYFINLYTGLLDPIRDIVVTFSLVSGNGGTLEMPEDDTTDSNGLAQNKYKTDQGDLTVKAKVKAQADLSGSPYNITEEVSATVEIKRIGEGEDDDDDDNPSTDDSTIGVVTPVLISTDGSHYSTVIVTVLNTDGNPLPGKKVVLAIVSGIGTIMNPPGSQLTSDDPSGQAMFKVWSSVVNYVTVKATIEDTIVLPTEVISFIDPSSGVVEQFFSVTVPFQNRNYDSWVCTKIKDQNPAHTGDDRIDYTGYFLKNSSNLLATLETIPFYLYPTPTTYDVWGKGKNHLAKSVTGKTAGASGTKLTIALANLPIGDIVTAASATSIKCPKPYHDNVINADDMLAAVARWFSKTADLFDLNSDGVVDTGDFWYIFINYGGGAVLP